MTQDLIDFNGQPAVPVQAPDGARAIVLLHGAHVVSWRPAGGAEQLYLSPQARYGEGQAVRGGVPVVFPQFEQRGPDRSLPRHGFVRQRRWQLESCRQGRDHAQATLQLRDDEATRRLWPHGFELELTVAVSGGQLDLELHVHNSGTSAWPFSAALHTYLAVSDLANVRLAGLDGRPFLDALTGGESVEDDPDKRFAGEFDRIYGQATRLRLRDGARQLVIESDNLPDAVVWNPGPDKAQALPDMPDQDWRRMLCIEAARIFHPKTLTPGETWTGRQSLALVRP